MKSSVLLTTVLLTFAAAPAVMADHMSPDGIGTAGMPNDIHNTRLDVRLSDAPNECFTSLVQQGDLADSVNRCAEDPEAPECVVYEVTDDCTVIVP